MLRVNVEITRKGHLIKFNDHNIDLQIKTFFNKILSRTVHEKLLL